MNLSEIVSNVKAELHPATDISTLIKRWANRGQKKFLVMANHKFSWMTLTNLTLTTIAGQNEYALSPLVDVAKVIVITDRVSPRKIHVISREEFLERVPNPLDTSGDPTIAYLSGFTPINIQPSSASVLALVSSSPSDTSQVVKIEGLSSAGVLIGEEVTLNGTTPVSTTNSYARILNRSNNGFLSGILTITSNSGAVTNAVISPRSRQGMYPKLVLYPTPADARTLYYDAYMRLPELVNDNDTSLLPENYHDAIENYCLYRGYRHKKDYQMAGEAKQAFEQTISQAVLDDRGPQREIVFQDYRPGADLPRGNLPGNFPRSY